VDFIPYYAGSIPVPVVQVSFERPFPNQAASYSMVPTGPGRFQIEATFDLAVLAASHGPTYIGSQRQDWFQSLHPSGGPATEMRAVVVTDNTALLPFSVSDILARVTDNRVILARNLDRSFADSILDELQR
jgi:hypothetical protein